MAYIKETAKGVRLINEATDRFKTGKISICFAVPLTKETAAANAILPYLLHHSCKRYPTMEKLNRKLAMLYGASIGAGVVKSGETQIIILSANAIDDRFALEKESVCAQCAELLCDMIFEPNFENGTFTKSAVEQEKRLMLERIDSEMDNKRAYALRRCEEIMCENEAYGLSRYGSKEDVEKLTPDDIFTAWQKLLKTAKIQVVIVGNSDVEQIEKSISQRIEKIDRGQLVELKTQFVKTASEVKEKTEEMAVKQGKLVMGFRVNMSDAMEHYGPLTVMNDVFGGGPYSRLFLNVREKMSLCYYCSSMLVRQKGLMMLQSGIENENKQKAIDEILNQFEIMKKGEFTDDDFAASKMAITDALNSYKDMPSDITAWYTNQIAYDDIFTTEQATERINAVTREQVTECARLVTLDTVYMLEGTASDSQEDK